MFIDAYDYDGRVEIVMKKKMTKKKSNAFANSLKTSLAVYEGGELVRDPCPLCTSWIVTSSISILRSRALQIGSC